MFKKMLITCSAALASVAVFAEGQTPAIDLTGATTQLTSMGTALVTWVTGILPQVAAVIGAGLTIALLFAGVRWLLRGTKTR